MNTHPKLVMFTRLYQSSVINQSSWHMWIIFLINASSASSKIKQIISLTQTKHIVGISLIYVSINQNMDQYSNVQIRLWYSLMYRLNIGY